MSKFSKYIVLLALAFLIGSFELFAYTDGLLQNKSLSEKLKILQDTIDMSANNQNILESGLLYLNLVKDKNDKNLLAKGYYNYGYANWLLSENNIAMSNFYKSLELSEEIKDTVIQINSSIFLGLIYGRFFEWEKTGKYFKNAYKLSHLYKNNYYIASSCWNMAFYSNNVGKYNDAFKYAYESLYYLSKSTFTSNYAKIFAYGLSYYYLADTYSYVKQFDSSNYYVNLSVIENKKINNVNTLSPAYNFLVDNYKEMKQYDKALLNAKISLAISFKAANIDYISRSYKQISELFELKNMPDSSLHYLKFYCNYIDTINKQDIRVVSAKLEAKNQEKLFLKEKELSEQKFNFSILISFTIVISLIIMTLLLYSRYRTKNRTNKQLAALNSTKDKLFTIISHDLKTPISSFNNLSGILNDYYHELSEEEKVKHIKSLKDSSGNIMVLLENLLTWSRMQTEKIKASPENLNLAEIIEVEIQNQIQFADKKNIEIVTEVETNSIVFADHDMTSVVIRNLLSNAIKFTNNNGIISISATDENGFVEISVADTGIGISDEDQVKLFQIDKKHSRIGTANEKGTGLGLNLCKEFIERNKGIIWFESELGKGSTFKFTLPKTDN